MRGGGGGWMPVPVPVSGTPVVAGGPSAGVPVQTVPPVNEVSVLPVWGPVPVPPSTLNAPVESNQNVDATFSVPEARFWPPPLTVVFNVPAKASRSIDVPVRVVSVRSMLALTPRIVVVMPSRLCPLLWYMALKLMAPDALTVDGPESTLMLVASISRVPPIPSRLPLISTLDLPALTTSKVMLVRAAVNEPEPITAPITHP